MTIFNLPHLPIYLVYPSTYYTFNILAIHLILVIYLVFLLPCFTVYLVFPSTLLLVVAIYSIFWSTPITDLPCFGKFLFSTSVAYPILQSSSLYDLPPTTYHVLCIHHCPSATWPRWVSCSHRAGRQLCHGPFAVVEPAYDQGSRAYLRQIWVNCKAPWGSWAPHDVKSH